MSDHNVVWTPLRLFSHILFILHLQFSTGGLAPGISGLAPMCTRPYTSFLQSSAFYVMGYFLRVNALSGLYLISTTINVGVKHFKSGCQCPLGLIPHFYKLKDFYENLDKFGVNALSGLYLISTVPLQKSRFYAVSRACFCRYLSEYSDNSRFSCMLTF